MDEDRWLSCTEPGRLLAFLGERASDRKLRLFACACARRVFHLLADGPFKEGVEVAEAYADGRCTREEYRRAALASAIDLFPFHNLGSRAAEDITNWVPGGWEVIHAFCHDKEDEVVDQDFRAALDAQDPLGATVLSTSPTADLARTDAATAAFLAAFRYLRRSPGSLAFRFCRSAIGFAALPETATDLDIDDVTDPAEEAVQAVLLRDIFGNPFKPIAVERVWLDANDGVARRLAAALYDERAFDRLTVLADALEEAGCDIADLLDHLREAGPHARGCWALDQLLELDR